LRDILEVGEALATFGNCQFPEHSNEHRTILAADFKRLMQEFLGKLGSVFVPGAVSNMPPDVQVGGEGLDVSRCLGRLQGPGQLRSARRCTWQGRASSVCLAPTL
jgi:hypothetical protein